MDVSVPLAPEAHRAPAPGLAQPVGYFMRRALAVAPEDTLARAAEALRHSGLPLVPVAVDGVVTGVVREERLGEALGDDVDLRSPVSTLMSPAPLIAPYKSGAEALRRLTDDREPVLVVADDSGRLMGTLNIVALFPRRRQPLRPPAIGGMATPFGVYLTTGTVSAGPPKVALVTTGMVMFGLLVLGDWLGMYVANSLIAYHIAPDWLAHIEATLTFIVFLAGMRLLPLSGIHAAEHQVVHTIERGEDLVPEVVSRMPRVHPRCGTNLAAGASLFLGIFGATWIPDNEIRLILAALITVAFWRRLGALLQQFVTTRPATPKQIKMGIQSGEQLLQRYASAHEAVASFPMRIWNSGMLHVMTGSLLLYGILEGVAWLFHWDLGL